MDWDPNYKESMLRVPTKASLILVVHHAEVVIDNATVIDTELRQCPSPYLRDLSSFLFLYTVLYKLPHGTCRTAINHGGVPAAPAGAFVGNLNSY